MHRWRKDNRGAMGYNSARDIFFKKIIEVAQDEDLYIVTADLAGKPFDGIREKMPWRYISTGIAEQNMAAVACGLCLNHKKALIYTQGAFIDTRPVDQIRNGICAMNLPVIIVGLGVGLGTAEYGLTHFVTEDYRIMTSLPNLEVITVADDAIAYHTADYVLKAKKPVYVRLERECYDTEDLTEIDFEKGYRIMKRGTKTVVISDGYLLNKAYKIDFPDQPTIIDIFKTPFDCEALIKELRKYEKLVIYEEQQRDGSMGSKILELLNDCDVYRKVVRLGIDYKGQFPHTYGTREFWLEKFGLDEGSLIAAVEGSDG